MAKKNNKVKIGFRRRLSLYYLRFMTLIKITILITIGLLLFTNFFDTQKQKLFKIFTEISAKHGFVFEHLITAGQKNIPMQDIMEAIGTDEGVPIYSLNIDDIKARMDESPWVKVSLVERRLPNTLYIAIVENVPIAIWQSEQKLYLIDENGNSITSKNIENFGDLIHVVGKSANVYARSLLEDLNKHSNLAKKVISAVMQGQRRWDLNLEQKINVKMPDKAFDEAYEYLNSLNKQDKLFNQNYKTIDLRDPSKYYLEKH